MCPQSFEKSKIHARTSWQSHAIGYPTRFLVYLVPWYVLTQASTSIRSRPNPGQRRPNAAVRAPLQHPTTPTSVFPDVTLRNHTATPQPGSGCRAHPHSKPHLYTKVHRERRRWVYISTHSQSRQYYRRRGLTVGQHGNGTFAAGCCQLHPTRAFAKCKGACFSYTRPW